MCVCIWKPKDKKLSKDVLALCWDRNPDGAGYMWAEDGRVKIRKGFMSFKKFWKSFKHAQRKIGSETGIAVHFRIGTSGMLDRRNCHPHRVSETLAFIHNGILPLEVPSGSIESDSMIFASMLAALPAGWQKDDKIKSLVEMAMGDRNKICLLDETGDAVLLNGDAGTWDDGIWFSNMHWDTRPAAVEEEEEANSNYFGYGNYEPNQQQQHNSGIVRPAFSSKSWKGYKPSKENARIKFLGDKKTQGTKSNGLKFRSVAEVYGAKRFESKDTRQEGVARDSEVERSEECSDPKSQAPESMYNSFEDKSGSSSFGPVAL